MVRTTTKYSDIKNLNFLIKYTVKYTKSFITEYKQSAPLFENLLNHLKTLNVANFTNLPDLKNHIIDIIDQYDFTDTFKALYYDLIESIYEGLKNNKSDIFVVPKNVVDKFKKMIDLIYKDINVVKEDFRVKYSMDIVPYIQQSETNPFFKEDDTKSTSIKKTNLKSIITKILVVILIIVSAFVIIGWIFGFIYAYHAESMQYIKTNEWDNWRLIKRAAMGFAYVATFWSQYGIW